MPAIGVVQTTRLRMRTNQSDDPIPFPRRDSKHLHLSVALQDPQHDHLAGGSPTLLSPPSPANRGLVVLDGALERLAQLLDMRAAGSDQSIETLNRRSTRRGSKPLPVHRNAQHEQFQ